MAVLALLKSSVLPTLINDRLDQEGVRLICIDFGCVPQGMKVGSDLITDALFDEPPMGQVTLEIFSGSWENDEGLKVKHD